MRLARAGILALLALNCCCCAFPVETSPETVYCTSLNLETLPPELNAFQGSGILYSFPLPAFLSHGYFTYEAGADYFARLEAHRRFAVESEFNAPIQQVPCTALPSDFSFWEEDGFAGPLDLANKECFTGTYVPFIHYLVYDPVSRQVWHFVEGMRD